MSVDENGNDENGATEWAKKTNTPTAKPFEGVGHSRLATVQDGGNITRNNERTTHAESLDAWTMAGLEKAVKSKAQTDSKENASRDNVRAWAG